MRQAGQPFSEELLDQFLRGDWVELHPMTLEGMFEAPLQHSLPVLPNVRLDELGPVLGVGRPLPLSFGDIGGPSRRGLPFFVQGEVFDVYPVVLQKKVRLVLSAFSS